MKLDGIRWEMKAVVHKVFQLDNDPPQAYHRIKAEWPTTNPWSDSSRQLGDGTERRV